MVVAAWILPAQEPPFGVCRLNPFTRMADPPVVLNFLPLWIASVEEKGKESFCIKMTSSFTHATYIKVFQSLTYSTQRAVGLHL